MNQQLSMIPLFDPKPVKPETEAQYWNRMWKEIVARAKAEGRPVDEDFTFRNHCEQTRGLPHVHFRHERGVLSPSLRVPDPDSFWEERYPFYRRVIAWGCVDCLFYLHFFIQNEREWAQFRAQEAAAKKTKLKAFRRKVGAGASA